METDQPLRLVERAVATDDPDPKAFAGYGLLVRSAQPGGRLAGADLAASIASEKVAVALAVTVAAVVSAVPPLKVVAVGA